MDWSHILFDIECNGFKPDKIWVIVMTDLITKKQKIATSFDEICESIQILSEAQMIAGHNIKSFDIKVLEKMIGMSLFDQTKILDTYHLSKAIVDLDHHDLETWGEILGFPKLKPNFSFFKFHPDMVKYCKRDVDLNYQILLFLLSQVDEKWKKVPTKWNLLTECQKLILPKVN